jgi:regulator of protease activity HflC (stomatin/prohibitin superfamily)
LPTGDRERADFHIWSGADNTVASRAVEAWITNCVKLEAPAFTGDEVWQNAAKRQEYYRLVKERVVSKLSPLKGLTITQFSITDIRLPADEAKAFQEKWVAEQMVIKAELELKVARAEAEAEVTMAKIKRDKQEALKELEKIPED